jgi:hypothetical protein
MVAVAVAVVVLGVAEGIARRGEVLRRTSSLS